MLIYLHLEQALLHMRHSSCMCPMPPCRCSPGHTWHDQWGSRSSSPSCTRCMCTLYICRRQSRYRSSWWSTSSWGPFWAEVRMEVQSGWCRETLVWAGGVVSFLWGCSQEDGWRYNYVKAWLRLEDLFPQMPRSHRYGTQTLVHCQVDFSIDLLECPDMTSGFPHRMNQKRERSKRTMKKL